jgi:hypothetical protein
MASFSLHVKWVDAGVKVIHGKLEAIDFEQAHKILNSLGSAASIESKDIAEGHICSF